VSEAVADGVLHLVVPADPALALTARMFAGALTEHLEDAAPEDLKLAFSELLAAAVDAGSDVVEYRVDLGRGEILVRGASVADAGISEDLEEHERFARAHRADLLTALFPRLRHEDGVLVLPLAAE
jgi:hypothetical protein